MKLQISFEFTNLPDALDLAKKTSQYADILEVGTLLIYKEGTKAINAFKNEFPNKEILADAKICDRPKDAIELFTSAGADIITVLAGTSNEIIHVATQTAHSLGKKIALDLMDSYSTGQSAMDSENLKVDSLIFIRSKEKAISPETAEQWESAKNNTSLPVFIAGNINKENIKNIIALKPHGVAIGKAIAQATDPEQEAAFFKSILK
ncbi:orotidine 5'-phosphate decarboxylase [Candidatus Babeliales bacterium]|nr:orotidine 5'-phosphate decarboxylase [Candidatus Babeliales bacterium]